MLECCNPGCEVEGTRELDDKDGESTGRYLCETCWTAYLMGQNSTD